MEIENFGGSKAQKPWTDWQKMWHWWLHWR